METQDDMFAAFSDVDHLLCPSTYQKPGCTACGSSNLERTSNPGMAVHYCFTCGDCGAVQSACYGQVDAVAYHTNKTSSNYKRIHHWHERISQLLLCESRIPDEKFVLIAERLCDGSHPIINKDVVRRVLRSLNMQLYIEKWLQIIQRVTQVEPPKPGAALLESIDRLFQALQSPFSDHKEGQRKNFLNYNYVFCRLFQMLDCPQFSMFFPLIKSKAKLNALDETWARMMDALGWQFTPLQLVPPFAVKLEQPDLQLQRIRQQVASAAQAGTHTVPEKTVFRKSDQHLLHELDRQMQRAQRRSAPPAPVPQRLGWSKKHPRFASAAKLQPLRRLQHRRRPG